MSRTIRHKYKYFYSTIQRAKDRRQKFHFCRLPFEVRPRNVKLNLSISSCEIKAWILTIGLWFEPQSLFQTHEPVVHAKQDTIVRRLVYSR